MILSKLKSNLEIYRTEFHEKGLLYIISTRIKKVIIDQISFYYTSNFKRKNTFYFNHKEYNYFNHKYNFTWKNERTVEVPILWSIVKNNKNKRILEIGNVLAHYYQIHHDVLDKYEIAPAVINEDVVTFKPKGKYDLIVSVSTLEHVGWDEIPRERLKILHAIENLKRMLKNKGKLIFTIPIGQNAYLDSLLKNHKIKFNEVHFLKRYSSSNLWKEATWDEVKDVVYNYPYQNANAIVYGIIVK